MRFAASRPPSSIPSLRSLASLAAVLALLGLTACETVSETLVLNETGTGSVLVDWTVSEQQLADSSLGAGSNQAIDRETLGEAVDAAFGTDGYVLSDQVAFNELRGERTGFSITKPLRDLDDVRALGTADLTSGRAPLLLWRDISLDEGSDGSLSLSATPSQPDRAAFLAWAAEQDGVRLADGGDNMIFVASFTPRGQIDNHNADEVDGNTLRWRIEGDEARELAVVWTPMAPETQSAVPFVAGLVGVIFLSAGALYLFDKRGIEQAGIEQAGIEQAGIERADASGATDAGS